MAERSRSDFFSTRFVAPKGVLATLLRPRLWRHVWKRRMGICIAPPARPEPHGHQFISFWTYDPSRFGNQLCAEFRSNTAYRRQHERWQPIADALWRLIDRHPQIVFRNVAIDLGDGETETIPADVFRFARRLGQPHDLLPNPYLLRPRPRLSPARPWNEKTDVLYFRGAATGLPDFSTNIRVTACIAAQTIPCSDCRLTSFPEVSDDFVDASHRHGIASVAAPLTAMNDHRFLLDVDGNTSSWDRFLFIGSFGGVPIRFESRWEECWHFTLREGVSYVSATRDTLQNVVDFLRSKPSHAEQIASAATALVRDVLSPENIDTLFETAWMHKIGVGSKK
jgi:hypothetical protein